MHALKIILVQFVLLSTICFQLLSQEYYSFEGAAKMRMVMPSGKMQEQRAVVFKLNVSDCQWRIRFHRDEGTNQINSPDYTEVSSDGVFLYYLSNLESAIANQKKRGANFGVDHNTAVARRYKGELFHMRFVDEVSPIWLAFASGCYFKNRTNDYVEPGFVFDSVQEYGPPERKRLKSFWRLNEFKPFMPVSVVYIGVGKIKGPNGDLIDRPSPYNNGFTNAVYRIISTTNINGVEFPQHSKLEIFRPTSLFDTNSPLIPFITYEMSLTAFLRRTGIFHIQPELPGITAIQDEAAFEGSSIPRVTYKSKDRWPTIAEVRSSGVLTNIQIGEPTGVTSITGLRRTWIILAMFVIPIAIAAMLFRWRKTNGNIVKSD